MRGLQVEPELGRCAEEAGQAEGGVGGHGTAAVQDLSNAGRGHAGAQSKLVRGEAHRSEEVLAQHGSGVGDGALDRPACGGTLGEFCCRRDM